MNTYKSIKALFDVLSKDEVKIFASTVNEKKDVPQSQKIIQLLMSNEDLSSTDIQKFLYGKNNYHAFNKILNRLRVKLLESLIFDVNLSRTGNYSSRNRENLRLRKELMQADILLLKGETTISSKLYRSIIKRAEEFEMYDLVMQGCYGLQRLSFGSRNKKQLNKLRSRILQAEICWRVMNESQSLFNEVINSISVSGVSESYSNVLNDAVNTLKLNFQKTNSNLIRYYLLTLESELMQSTGMYKLADKCYKETESLILKKSVYTDNRYGSLLINIANNYLFLNNYESCLEYSERALRIYKNIPITLNIVYEMMFFAHYYKEDYNACIEKLTLMNKNRLAQSAFLENRIIYYSAWLNFAQKNYLKCLSELKDVKEVLRDIEGYNVCTRLLKILCHIELRNNEYLDHELQNLQQFIKRNKGNRFIRKRYLIFVKVLIQVINSDFQFNKCLPKVKKYMAQFNSDDRQYCYLIRSPELFNLQNWFYSHL